MDDVGFVKNAMLILPSNPGNAPILIAEDAHVPGNPVVAGSRMCMNSPGGISRNILTVEITIIIDPAAIDSPHFARAPTYRSRDMPPSTSIPAFTGGVYILYFGEHGSAAEYQKN
jgi:hypothetical protein